MITIEDFSKVKLKIGIIKEAFKLEDADKLLILKIDVGENELRQIVSGIADYYNPTDLINKKCIVVSNLEPKELRGVQSNGMVLCSIYKDENDNKVVSIIDPSNSPIGAQIS